VAVSGVVAADCVGDLIGETVGIAGLFVGVFGTAIALDLRLIS
jgi:hypothetical protein